MKRSNKETKALSTPALILLVILIMGLSVFARLASEQSVRERLGEYCTDAEEDAMFLTEMDSYYHLRMTEDIIDHGHPGESVVDGKNWDDYSYAPAGRSADDYTPFMANVAAFAYRLFGGIFGISLYKIIYYLGAFLSALVVIPVFVLAKRLGGSIAGVVAAVISAVNYGYFIHTVPGFYDTDMVISFASCFMLMFGVLFIESFDKKEKAGNDKLDNPGMHRAKQIALGVLFALSIYILRQTWIVYSLYVGIFGAALVIYMILTFATKNEAAGESMKTLPNEAKADAGKKVLPLLATAVGTALFVIMIDPGIFKSVISYAGSVFAGSSKSLFPDAYVSVSEMRKPSFLAGGFSGLFQMKVLSESNVGIINAVGGLLPFAAAVFVWVMLIIAVIKKKGRFQYFVMLVWLPVTMVLAVRGWRFMVLLAVPVSILAGIFAGGLFDLMESKKLMDRKIYIAMVMALLLFPATYGTYRSLGDAGPAVNNGLNDTVKYIRDNTPDDTIIASWWDYGYYYEQKAKRRTLFDGGSQDGMRVFWVGRALATTDEELSVNILRMLAGSGDTATERMFEVYGENNDTLNLMLEALAAGKDKAGEVLAAAAGSGQTASGSTGELIQLLFPDVTSPVLCLITPDMSGICGWFNNFGFWNEKKDIRDMEFSVIMNEAAFKPTDGKCGWRFGYNGEECVLVLEESKDGYSAYTSHSAEKEDSQPLPVEKVLVRKGGVTREYEMEPVGASDAPGTTILLDYDKGGATTFMTSDVMESVFGRLFYLGGAGLTHYTIDPNAVGSAAVYDVK